MANNRVIGKDGTLPWHLPDDLRRFKALTLGHPIIMGRRTWESIGRPLPGRTSIVVTRQTSVGFPEVTCVPGLPEALALVADHPDVFVIGGAQLYAAALPRADRLFLTQVQATLSGDTTFPEFAVAEWELIAQEPHAADDHHAFPFVFQEFRRRRSA